MQQKRRAFNFCSCQSTLPESVLQRAKNNFFPEDKGFSLIEMSHRSDEYIDIAKKAETNIRLLLNIPCNYKILFMQGGASQQFSAIPLNLLPYNGIADYMDTGFWSKKSINEACKFGTINIVASNQYTIPDPNTWNIKKNASYFHYTSNETIGGLEFHYIPEINKNIPLISDMSSNILSRPLDISKFGVIYASAQKNIGISGLVIVIIREDLLGKSNKKYCPSTLNYTLISKNKSMYNTPSTYSWYLAGLVLEWLKEQGGLYNIKLKNKKKQELLYQTIDNSEFYINHISPNCRSFMNVTFHLLDKRLDNVFIKGAAKHGLMNLKGHNVTGGMRASLYNALEIHAVKALIKYMNFFEKKYG